MCWHEAYPQTTPVPGAPSPPSSPPRTSTLSFLTQTPRSATIPSEAKPRTMSCPPCGILIPFESLKSKHPTTTPAPLVFPGPTGVRVILFSATTGETHCKALALESSVLAGELGGEEVVVSAVGFWQRIYGRERRSWRKRD
jgi:hypothetical protein